MKHVNGYRQKSVAPEGPGNSHSHVTHKKINKLPLSSRVIHRLVTEMRGEHGSWDFF